MALAVVVLGLTGCASSRQVTPWLRTSVTRPFVIMAESGGPKAVAKTERLVDGAWREISHDHRAMPLRGGAAAINLRRRPRPPHPVASVVSDDWTSCKDASFWSDLHVDPGEALEE